jgi:NAD+ kinase
MKIALFSIGFREKFQAELNRVLQTLNDLKIEITVYEDLAHFTSKDRSVWCSYEDLKKEKVDFLLSLGGDGTILKSVTLIRDLEIPIIGLNLGRLGFLANVEKDAFVDHMNRIISGDYFLEDRTLVALSSNYPLFGNTPFALNEFTILKRDSSSMVTIHTYLNDNYLSSYWCDGLIISTPTGSTAYNLSCGGPILFPTSKNIIVTPVSPHNLNVRPLVLPDDVRLSFKIEGRTDQFLCTLDSRKEIIGKNHDLEIRKGDFGAKLVRFEKEEFIDTMRRKLNWGQDVRNW